MPDATDIDFPCPRGRVPELLRLVESKAELAEAERRHDQAKDDSHDKLTSLAPRAPANRQYHATHLQTDNTMSCSCKPTIPCTCKPKIRGVATCGSCNEGISHRGEKCPDRIIHRGSTPTTETGHLYFRQSESFE